LVDFEHIEGWGSAFYVETEETPAELLTRLGREGVVMDRTYETAFHAPSQIKRLLIRKED
jgi:hypothetical protein